MPAGWPITPHPKRFARTLAIATLAVATVVGCAGPETGDDRDPTPTPTATATATASPTPELPTATVAASPTQAATATAEPTPTSDASPTSGASPTNDASPTAEEVALPERLPLLDDMPAQGYTIAEEGTRTAEELANAYEDAPAHLRRLDEWGFKQHLFRAFSRESSDNDQFPPVILTTINEYGSDEQAEAAMQWLKQLGTATGATDAEAPRVGDNAVALTVPTSDGVPTASVYVREGPVLFVYFAQGGDPLPAVVSIATKVFGR
jgi:hypothetical protein